MKIWSDFSLSPKDKDLTLSHPLRWDYLHQQQQLPSSTSGVLFDHLMIGSLAKNRRCPAKLWQIAQLSHQPYLLWFYWGCGKKQKDTLFIWSFLCAAMASDWRYHRWYNVPDNCSQSSTQGAQAERRDSQSKQARCAYQPLSEPLKHDVAWKYTGQF